jgi:hypothetical protein
MTDPVDAMERIDPMLWMIDVPRSEEVVPL